jgi:hypothetical protein
MEFSDRDSARSPLNADDLILELFGLSREQVSDVDVEVAAVSSIETLRRPRSEPLPDLVWEPEEGI